MLGVLNEDVQRRPERWLDRVSELPPELVDLERFERGIAYLGDSVIAMVAKGEEDRRGLWEMVQEESGLPTTQFCGRANHPGVFLAQLTYLRCRGKTPDLLIVPVSLSSFGPGRALRPSYHFGLRCRMLETGLFLPFRAAAVFKMGFGELSREEFLRQEVVVGGRPLGTMEDLRPYDPEPVQPVVVRNRFLTHYATDITKSPYLDLLRRLLGQMREAPFPCLIYLTPFDVEQAASLLREDEMASVRRNLSVLIGMFGDSGLEFVDLGTILSHDQFDHPEWSPNEHLRSAGRRRVALRIAEVIPGIVGQ
ncbi:MAG: hypothetical protein HY722_02555 [Planctomycetes bacterium]|nr:hypothetical protein [Planctomycetota bacterium]